MGNMKCKSLEIEEASLFDLRKHLRSKAYSVWTCGYDFSNTILLRYCNSSIFLLVDVLKAICFSCYDWAANSV